MRRFRVACSRCDLVLHLVDRIGEDELRALRQHLRAAHASDAAPDDAPAGRVLAFFSIHEVTT
jgi:hypothetical protein